MVCAPIQHFPFSAKYAYACTYTINLSILRMSVNSSESTCADLASKIFLLFEILIFVSPRNIYILYHFQNAFLNSILCINTNTYLICLWLGEYEIYTEKCVVRKRSKAKGECYEFAFCMYLYMSIMCLYLLYYIEYTDSSIAMASERNSSSNKTPSKY